MRCLTFHDNLDVGKVKAVSADLCAATLRRLPQHRLCLDTAALVIFQSSCWLPASRVILCLRVSDTNYHQMISLSGSLSGDGHA